MTLERMRSDRMSPALFYADYFGINFDDKSLQWITLKVYQPQVNYLRSVPLHPSQKEIDALLGFHYLGYTFGPAMASSSAAHGTGST